jgi:SNF2 family DNA or RNA helicase
VRAALELAGSPLSLLPERRGDPPTGPVESWLRGLTGRDARVDASPAALAELRTALDAWHRSAAEASEHVRVCFRLVAPAPDDPAGTEACWLVEFLMQDIAEPSLVVGAEQVWRDDPAMTAFGRHAQAPQEALLAELGRASRLWPELDDALRTAAPAGLTMDTQQADKFLRGPAALLAQAGFGVLLPSVWRAGNIGLKLTATSSGTPGTGGGTSAAGSASLVDYRWEIAVGDQVLTRAELDELAKAKAPLVRLRGQWVEVDQSGLRTALGFVDSRAAGQMTVQDLVRTGLANHGQQADLPVVDLEATGWLRDLLSGQLERRIELLSDPAGLAATLRPYQQRGVSWLAFLSDLGLGAVLADDMGLGKTLQTLALLVHDREAAGELRTPTLLVCPMSVVGNWQRETARFAPGLAVHVHHGADRLRADEFVTVASRADLVITTYALATRDADLLGRIGWRRVVLDEAQHIKNPASRQSRAVRALPAGHRLALTGTPVENRLAELWSIMDFVNPGLLGSLTSFRDRFAVPVERHGDELAARRLKKIIRPFLLRRVKSDPSIISDLPDKIEMTVLCNLTAEQAALYQAVVDDMLGRIGNSAGIERKGLVLATMAKLKQVCNHPAHLLKDGTRLAGRSGKLARLEEILDEVLAEGDKALCFTQFTEFGAMLNGYLADRFGRQVLYLHGGTPKRRRDEMIAAFEAGDGPPIFLLSLKAGGTGLNLTAANHVIHIDRWWNPAVEDQATDRAFRIGQRKHVQVRKFVCVGTVEERIDAMIEQKKQLAQMTVGSGESWLTELPVDELRAVVALSTDAVSE